MIAAPKASDAAPPKPPTTHAAWRLPKLGERAAQIEATNVIAQDARNTGRFPKYIAVGTQKKFCDMSARNLQANSNKLTPRPNIRITQLISPEALSILTPRSCAMVKKESESTVPLMLLKHANMQMAAKAMCLRHFGQLSGSLGSSEGWGTSIVSCPATCCARAVAKVTLDGFFDG